MTFSEWQKKRKVGVSQILFYVVIALSGLPGVSVGITIPCLALHRKGFSMPLLLPLRAVGSYPTFSPLPHTFLSVRRYIFCGTFHQPSLTTVVPSFLRHPSLWCPDFPLHLAGATTPHLYIKYIHFTIYYNWKSYFI